jgi:tetratricopeptide (TPR) repeat protein
LRANFSLLDSLANESLPPFVHWPALDAGAPPGQRAAALRALGAASIESRLLLRARKLLNASLELEPRSAETWMHLAVLDFFDPGHAGSRADVEHALAIQPRLIEGLAMLAELDYQDGDWEAGRVVYEKMTRLYPNDARGFYGLGVCLGRQNRWAQARVALERCLILEPENRNARQMLDQMASLRL